MVFALHAFCTIFLALVGWSRWQTFYEDGYTIRQNPWCALGEVIWIAVVGYMLYLMWVGK